MTEKNVYVFLFNGYSDWEISYATPEILNSRKYGIKTFSMDGGNVISMGGLNVHTDKALTEIDTDNMALLILPGGTAWEERKLNEIVTFVHSVKSKNIPIGAICGATLFLADTGILNNIKHTSNAKDYLMAMSPGYKGGNNYQDVGAVCNDNIITASGIAPIEFAREIFLKLEIYEPAMIEKWFQLFKHGIWAN